MDKNMDRKINGRGRVAVQKGMSFVEAIIGIFIFSVVMFAVMTIFTSSFGGYRKAEKMAKNIENAQFLMNTMAKSLRTSSILACNSGGCGGASPVDRTEIRFFDYSQGICGRYVFSGGRLRFDTPDPADRDITDTAGECAPPYDVNNFTVSTDLFSDVYVEGGFTVVRSSAVPGNDKRVGRATIRIKVCSEQDCAGTKNDQVTLQTTVSLRDYSTVGL